MTHKEALSYAISAIERLPRSEAGDEAILILSRISESCRYIRWTRESVFEALDQWKKAHDRNPIVSDLSEPNMPNKVTVKRLFSMNPSSFLNLYYPKEKKKKSLSKYEGLSKEDHIAVFIAQYQKHKPKSSKEYDLFRDSDTPTWLTAARHCGITKWSELLAMTEVERYGRASDTSTSRSYKVCVHNPSFDKVVELLEEQRNTYTKNKG